MPSTVIARNLGNVSARTVSNRINTLIENGIINVRAVVNPEKVGYGVMADVFVEVEPGKVRAVAQQAAEFPQRILFTTVGEEPVDTIPPALAEASFPYRVQLVMPGAEPP